MERKKVLIIEDENALSKALSSAFENKHIQTITARDGLEGLSIALKEKPDLILLDLVMPKMDGIEMLEKLRKDNWGKDVKVIILTNLEDKDRVSSAIKNGVFDYIVKSSWDIHRVIKKVEQELKHLK